MLVFAPPFLPQFISGLRLKEGVMTRKGIGLGLRDGGANGFFISWH